MSGDFIMQVLAGAALKGAVILALAAVLSLLMRRAPASYRHLVWSLALGTVLLTPVLTPLVPQWIVPGLPRLAPSSTQAAESEAVAASEAVTAAGSRGVNGGLPTSGPAQSIDVEGGVVAEVPARSIEAPPIPDRLAGGAPARAGIPSRAGFPWGAVLFFVWLAGALVVGAGIALGVARTWYLAGHARPVRRGRSADVANQIAARLGITRHVAVLQCQGSCMPMTWGLERPCILLPAEAEDWPDDLLHTVLLHELAHVKRFDYLTQLLARLACAIHWFNPLVWLAARRLRIERELACDDEVLRAGSRASDYAAQLLEMALFLKARPFLASVAMARASQLSARLRAVLDSRRARRSPTPGFVISATLCAALVALTVAAASPSRAAEDRGASVRPDRARVAVGRSLMPLADIIERPVAAARAEAPVRDRVARTARTVERGLREPIGAVTPLGTALCDWDARSGSSSTSIQMDDDNMRVKMEVDDCELEVDLSGKITFSADETEIVALSPGGELEIEEKRGRSSRRLQVEA
ncbi:MAG: M56 family metallopeptidase, partial [Gemmatimonadales bacterium]